VGTKKITMEAAAVAAMNYCSNIRRQRIEQHLVNNINEKKCSGLTTSEYFRTSVRQKSTFSKGKRFSCTRLWNHRHVRRGEE
jgi:hypothetical protein